MSTPIRILLIEDDESQALAMTRWIEFSGEFEVDHVSTGYAAEAYLTSEVEWGVIVSDIDLPGMNGLDVLELCKTHRPHTPVLMVTAHRKFDYALEAVRRRADDFLVKPLGKERLQAKVRELVEAGRRAAAARPNAEVVVAIGAHPDDVEIGCGGILLDHARRGDRVVILTLTTGEAGGESRTRIQESKRAAEAIGAELRMFELPDRSISEGPETIQVIERILSEVQPSIVYTHTANDAHQDHRAVHRATMVAARGVPNVYCYQAPSTTVDFRPSLFVNVDAHMEGKLELIRCYETQTAIRSYLAPDVIRSTARYWGRFSDYTAVEPLEVVRRTA